MQTAYSCLKCEHRFEIAITELESASSLDPSRSDMCPKCRQRVGIGPVQCGNCGTVFDLAFPHWHVLCDLATGECPTCRTLYQSLCVC